MKLHSAITLNEGITHIEDLPIDDFIRTVRDLKSKVVTEKMDGANLWFGVDENGLFTSREGKSKRAKRFYNISDYPLVANYNGFRAAHLALKKAEHGIEKILSDGDMIEIEVIFGRQPNTVTYGAEDKNYIVILRAVEGTDQDKAERLSKALHGKSVTVKPQIVTSPDGNKLEVTEPTQVWQFTEVKPIDTKSVDTSPALEKLKEMENWLGAPAENVPNMTNREVIEAKLGKIDKSQRDLVKSERETLKQRLLDNFKLPIKEFLLGTLVRKIKPSLQGEVQPDEDVGVEGVVVRDTNNGEMVKIVDKDVFTAINKFNNSVRGQIAGLVKTDDQDAPVEARGGVFGDAKIRIGMLFGMKELALSSSARKILSKFKGVDAAETAKNMADNIQVTDFEAIRHKVAAILKSSLAEIDNILVQFKENSGSYKLKLKTGKEIGFSPDVMKRNLTAFAETKVDINKIITAVLKARTMPELIIALYGRTIQSLFDTNEADSVKESIFKQINQTLNAFDQQKQMMEDDVGGAQPPATGAAAISGPDGGQAPEKRLFGNRVVVKRQRNFKRKPRFAQVTESLLKLVEFDAAVASGQFATDVNDTVNGRNDVEFKALRNQVNAPGANGAAVSQTDISNYLDKAHELNDEVDTVTFGMEMDDGSVAKVYVNATQADQFEQTLADMLGKEDNLEKVIDDLAQNFDIVDVEWPQTMAQPMDSTDLGTDSQGDPVLDPVIDLGNLDDEPPEDDADGGLLKAINGMKNPEDIDLAPGAELPPEETGEGVPPSDDEDSSEDLDLIKSVANGEEGDGGTDDTQNNDVGIDTTVFDDGTNDQGDEGGSGDDNSPAPEDDGSGGEVPDVDLGDADDEDSDDDSNQTSDEDANDTDSDSEETPKKKKASKDDEDEDESTTTQESAMTFGQQFKDKLLLEKKETKKSKKKIEVDSVEGTSEFPASLQKLMQFFPQRGEKMMVALMWTLGAPIEALVMKKSDLRDSVQSSGDMYQKDSQFRLWVSRVINGFIAAEKTQSTEKEVKENKLEDELNSVYQKVVLEILDRIGLPSSIERIARLQLRNNVREKAALIQRDSHLRAYVKILAELLGVDAITGMRMAEAMSPGLPTDAANDDDTAPNQQAQQAQRTDVGDTSTQAWVDTVKELAIALGIPSDIVNYKQTQTDMMIKKQRQSIKNNGVVLRRAQQLLALVKGNGAAVNEAVEFDRAASEKAAAPVVSALKKQFDVDYSINKDGSVTVVVNGGSVAPHDAGNKNVASAKNVSAVIDRFFKAYREKGVTFTQPVSNKFTIGVKA
jgi:hypothetical protein